MNDFIQYISTLGDLHDSKLVKITWSAEESILYIVVSDIYSNFEGYPGYNGQHIKSHAPSLRDRHPVLDGLAPSANPYFRKQSSFEILRM